MADPFDPRATERVVAEAVRRGRRRRRAWLATSTTTAAAAIATVVALAAVGTFGGGGATHVSTSPTSTTVAPRHPTTTTAPPKQPTTTVAKPATSTTSPTTTKTSSTTTPTATAACQAGQLRLTLTRQSGSMGTGLAQVIVQNTSASSCRLDGYPQVSLANASGRTSGRSTDTTPGVAPNPPLGTAPAPAMIQLTPGDHAVFWFTWQDNPVGSQTNADCVSPAREAITPPGSSAPVNLTQALNTLVCSAPLVEPVEPAGFVPNGLQGGP